MQQSEIDTLADEGFSMLERTSSFQLNVVQQADALELLRSLPDACSPLAFLDPQHRSVLDKLKFGNEETRQRGRAGLPAMSDDYIDAACLEITRTLKPSAYLMRWLDTFGLCEAHLLRVPCKLLAPVDLIAGTPCAWAWANAHADVAII